MGTQENPAPDESILPSYGEQRESLRSQLILGARLYVKTHALRKPINVKRTRHRTHGRGRSNTFNRQTG